MTLKFFFYGIFTDPNTLIRVATDHGFRVRTRRAKLEGYALGSKTVNSIAYMYPDKNASVLGVAAEFTYVNDPKDRIGTVSAFNFPEGAARRLVAYFDNIEGYYDTIYANDCHYVRSYVVPLIKESGASPYTQADEFYMAYISKATRFRPMEINPAATHVGPPRQIETYEWNPDLKPRRLTRQKKEEETNGRQLST